MIWRLSFWWVVGLLRKHVHGADLLAPLFRRLQTALEASERRLSATAPVMRLILRTVHSSARQNIEQVRNHLYATHQGAPIDRSFTTLSGCSFSLCHSRIYNICGFDQRALAEARFGVGFACRATTCTVHGTLHELGRVLMTESVGESRRR
jgi:hypothetical protein